MKTYTKFIEITPKEALLALAQNDGKPVDGFAFRRARHAGWVKGEKLSGVDLTSNCPFLFNEGIAHKYANCARVIEVNPRDVPEGCTPLPENKPWLAYVGLGPMPFEDPKGHVFYSDMFDDDWRSCSCDEPWHYAIDVRTDFAKQHFPEIVEAMGYEEVDPFLEWYKANGVTITNGVWIQREAWNAAIKHMEGKQ